MVLKLLPPIKSDRAAAAHLHRDHQYWGDQKPGALVLLWAPGAKHTHDNQHPFGTPASGHVHEYDDDLGYGFDPAATTP